MILRLNTTFMHDYEIDTEVDLPSSIDEKRFFHYPLESPLKHDGVMVKVFLKDGTSWLGIFPFGDFSRDGITAAFACPNPIVLCIVSKGKGHMVNTNNPEIYHEIPMLGIIDVRLIAEKNLILFANCHQLIAYDKQGIAWQNSSVVPDELAIVDITSDSILLTGLEPAEDKTLEYEIDVNTGISRRA